jgi:hypothetical protein
MVKYLQSIKEEEDHEQESNELTMEMIALGMTPGKRNSSTNKRIQSQQVSIQGSFIGAANSSDNKSSFMETEE